MTKAELKKIIGEKINMAAYSSAYVAGSIDVIMKTIDQYVAGIIGEDVDDSSYADFTNIEKAKQRERAEI